MRKFFTSLKSVVAATLVAAMAFSVSCSYDDSELSGRVDQVEKDLAALTERVAALETKLQSEVEALTALINGKVVVVDVTTDADGNQTIELSNGETITVLAPTECTCEPSEPCQCDPLQYRVVDGVLEVSADGANWVAINGVAAECVVANIVINDDSTATITLANGDEFTVVKAELIECEATRSQLFVAPGETKSVKFTINDAVSDVNVMNQPLGWTASIEVAPVVEDEDNVDPGMGILAAGGTDFLLNITGPSADFVNAGYAQKEGFVAVHFNSANGGCKVAKVAVNLAELGISVDASGNITITNSVAKSAGFDEMGEPMYDFADFFVGIVDAADYATYGDKVFVDTFDDYTYEYTANVASTQRTTGFQNIVDLQWYEAGVCEKESYTLTVDQLAGAFWPKYQYEMGKEYIIFVTTESEMANFVEQPVLTNAAKASYKRVFVEANLNKETTTWNDATVDFTLAGYNYYIVGWLPVADLEQFVMYGQAADIDSALVFYLKNGGNLMGAGAVVADMQGTYKLSELAALSMTQWAPMLNADTEYLFFVYPMNAETEMDFYTHQVVEENIRNYGSFRTKALVQGEFDAAAQFELVLHNEQNIKINVTLPEGVTNAYYTWFESPVADPEEALYQVMNDVYANATTEATFSAEKYGHNGLPNPIYFALIAINEAGEYVYVEQEFLYIEPEPIALVSWEYKGRHFDIDDNVETSGGDHVYIAKAVDGTEFTIGLYYTFADENGVITPGEYSYCSNYFNAMYGSWNGFVIISDSYYTGSKMIVTEDTVKIKIKGGNIYLFDKNATNVDPEQPEQPEQPEPIEPSASAALVTDTTFGGFNPYDVTFTFENGDQVTARFNTLGTQYLHLGNWQADNWQDPHYISQAKYNGEYAAITACNVAYENDAYTVTMSVFEYTNYATLNYTFTGAIEGLNAPEACDCLKEPEQPEGGEGDVINITIQNLTVGYDQPGEKEMQFWYSATNAHVIDFKGFDNCNPGQPLAAGTYSSAAYTIDADYSIFDYGTTNGPMSDIEVVVTDNGDGTYTYDAKFSHNGQKYAFVYTGAYPA